jgi:hypothetical protein
MTMNLFSFLARDANNYNIVKKISFIPIGKVSKENYKIAENFATQMTTKGVGEHRDHRTGGTQRRSPGQIFQDALNGKVSEFALYEFFISKGLEIDAPDVGVYSIGKWDAFDFQLKSKKLNVKSTKYFGNLLLLETGDWNSTAEYIPNIQMGNHLYDYFILMRMNGDLYDVPGYITKDDLIYIINNGYILPKGSMLNGKMRMDAENYYIQSGNLRNIEDLVEILKSGKS